MAFSIDCVNQLKAFGRELWEERPDLHGSFSEPDSFEFWCWLLLDGVNDHPDLAELRPPVPPRNLLDRVIGETVADEEFHSSGLVDARRMVSCLSSHEFQFQHGSLLDFGCGCGRVMRFLACFADSLELHGADADREAIEWCRESLGFASFVHSGQHAPLPYDSDRFDGLYAYSVFTHLSLMHQREWLAELHRILKPDGLAVITTMGQGMLDLLDRGWNPNMKPMVDERRHELAEQGALFAPYHSLTFINEDHQRFFSEWNLDEYGDCFLFKPYIESHWTDLFVLIDYIPAPDGSQDYVILKNRT